MQHLDFAGEAGRAAADGDGRNSGTGEGGEEGWFHLCLLWSRAGWPGVRWVVVVNVSLRNVRILTKH